MSSPSETSRVALLLTNRLVEVDAQPFTAREYWTLVERVEDLATLLGVSASDLVQIVGSVEQAERVTTLLGASTAFAFEQERLEEGGIAVLSSADGRFPTTLRQRLGNACPPFLLVAGPIDWLDGNALGVVGSRETSDEMLAVADAAAAAAVNAGWAVVSGLARGVDQAAMKGALDRGGRVIGVPAEGIRRSARNAEIRRHVRGHMREVHDYLAGVLRRVQAEGGIHPDRDPEAEAWIFVAGSLLVSIADRLGGPLRPADFDAIKRERLRWLCGDQ